MNEDQHPVVPMIRKGVCSECGGTADELWHRTDWWHNAATDCHGRKTGRFVANETVSECENLGEQ